MSADVPGGEVTARPATTEDLSAVADIHSSARAASYPAMPRSLHDAADVHGWVSSWDLVANEVWLALAGDRPVGYARVAGDWLNDLYVDPEAQGTGVGSMLLDVAKSLRPQGFCLWVFDSNTPARDFYAHRDLVDLERTDGAGNEEKEPDIKMAWPGADPLAFYRRLVDELDGELAGLLHRRVALTHAIQRHKTDSGRDLDREREIAEAMARRAPLLGAERLQRIVHAIVTESLDAAT